jgi:hypothetical protein
MPDPGEVPEEDMLPDMVIRLRKQRHKPRKPYKLTRAEINRLTDAIRQAGGTGYDDECPDCGYQHESPRLESSLARDLAEVLHRMGYRFDPEAGK